MFSEAWLCDEVRRKKEKLEQELEMTAWKEYLICFDSNFPGTVEGIDRMRRKYWGNAESRPFCYSISYKNEYTYQNIGERYLDTKSYSKEYDPVYANWSEIRRNVFKFNELYVAHGKDLDSIFEVAMVSACLVYHWGLSILNENKTIASVALYEASGLFDTCLGMVYAKSLDEKQKKISKKRVKAGRKGGETKAEVYELIQQELIRLLVENCPEGRWKTKVAAVEHVFSSLWQFVKKIQLTNISSPLSTMTEDKLMDRIAVWSTKGELKDAFIQTVARRYNRKSD